MMNAMSSVSWVCSMTASRGPAGEGAPRKFIRKARGLDYPASHQAHCPVASARIVTLLPMEARARSRKVTAVSEMLMIR